MKMFLLADEREGDVMFRRRAFAKNNITFPLEVATDGEEAPHYLPDTSKF